MKERVRHQGTEEFRVHNDVEEKAKEEAEKYAGGEQSQPLITTESICIEIAPASPQNAEIINKMH